MLLFFDTETTGIPDWHTPSGDDCQPHIVQLAAALVDEKTFDVAGSINLIIKPDGWDIPKEVTEIHGITNEIANESGVEENLALVLFIKLWKNSTIRIGHNVNFDNRIIRIATKRYCIEEVQEEWKAGEKYCTMYNSTKICKIPQTSGRGKYKFPKLSEAYEFFTGKKLEDAHNAWADLMSCIEVYKCLTSK